MYEGNPGNQGVYPSKYDEDEELGLIRIDLATISVVKKKFSSTKTKLKHTGHIPHFGHVPIVERLVEGACACKHPAYIRHFGHVPFVERLVEGAYGFARYGSRPRPAGRRPHPIAAIDQSQIYAHRSARHDSRSKTYT